jgi:hypothetical protein
LAVEIQPDHLGAELRALSCILDSGDAADFDLQAIHLHEDVT